MSAILVLWLATMGLLVRREILVPRVDPFAAESRRIEEPTESWMTLSGADGQRLGYVHLQHIPERREAMQGMTSRLAVKLSLNLFGRSTDLDLSGSAWRPYDLESTDFEFRVRSGDYDFRIDGRVADGLLRGEVQSAGEVLPLEAPVSQEIFFSGGFGAALTLPDLAVGDEVRIDSFDPLTLRATPTRVRCVAREVRMIAGESISARVISLESSGLRTRAWVDDEGNVLRAETPLGLTLERTTAENALRPIDGTNVGGFLELTAIRPAGERPYRGARAMTFEISGVDGEELPTDDVQRAIGENLYRIERPGPPPLTAGSAPLTEHLRADAFVQSDHPRIVSQARAIVGENSLDAWPRALALHRWVYGELAKEAVISIPSALEVLEQRRGDCNEHTVLYTALARSVGLPTRIAIGIVWSDDLGGFYYHAWPEVQIDGRWIWIDPTLGQELADATHIKILNGGIETWSQLLPFLGRLEVRVLEIED